MVPGIQSYKNIEEFSEAAASLIIELAKEYIRKNGRFTFVLSGGNTPKTLYEHLSRPGVRDSIDWSSVMLFWGDERNVPKDHPDSNYDMAFRSLISKVPLPEENIFRVPTEIEPVDEVSKAYEAILSKFFNIDLNSKKFPSFDLILLGMGKDGHTASLFAGSTQLKEKERWVVTSYVPPTSPVKERITFTLPLLNNALNVVYLISGIDKKDIMRTVLKEKCSEKQIYPSGMVSPKEKLIWFTDIPEEEYILIP